MAEAKSFFEALEDTLVARVKRAAPQARVEPWPDSPAEFFRPQVANAIYLRIGDLLPQLTDQQSPAPFIQVARLEIEVRILLKNLRTHVGTYASKESIFTALSGYVPASNETYIFKHPGLQLIRSGMIERRDQSAQWDWGLKFSAPLNLLTERTDL